MKKLFMLWVLCTGYYNLNAQRLPRVQTEGMRAPVDIKIDGKAKEWGIKLMAYNPAVGFKYTMANDNDFLYIVIQARDQDVINRILSGGITLSAGNRGEGEAEPVSLTYPVSLERGIYYDFRDVKRTSSPAALDSLITAFNYDLQTDYKWIKVTGMPDLGRTVSIYNDVNLKVAQTLDKNNTYTCEFAIALKYLGIAEGGGNKFTYHMIVNGSSARFYEPVPYPPNIVSTSNLTNRFAVEHDVLVSAARFRNSSLRYPTDFWGEYRLVK